VAHTGNAPHSVITDPSAIADGTITFIGTATVLVRFGGFTILTDPNFFHRGQHARLGYGLRSRRRTEPAMQIQDLPPLDLVVLSHFHEDHFDRIAERYLDKSVPIVTTEHAADQLAKRGFTSTIGVNPWRSHVIDKGDQRIRVTATPAQHGPRLVSRLLPPTMGSIWEFEQDGAPSTLHCSTWVGRGSWASWSPWTRTRAWR
jgi:L-ascorbate metabolism protein UlaG (beta-lactamase superfamily)